MAFLITPYTFSRCSTFENLLGQACINGLLAGTVFVALPHLRICLQFL